jgi:hypothetical protein
MITQTYIFRDLPKAIINDENDRGLKWTRGVEDDIMYELGEYLNTRWSTDVTEKDLILTVDVLEEDAKFLEVALHNLHQAKLIS